MKLSTLYEVTLYSKMRSDLRSQLGAMDYSSLGPTSKVRVQPILQPGWGTILVPYSIIRDTVEKELADVENAIRLLGVTIDEKS